MIVKENESKRERERNHTYMLMINRRCITRQIILCRQSCRPVPGCTLDMLIVEHFMVSCVGWFYCGRGGGGVCLMDGIRQHLSNLEKVYRAVFVLVKDVFVICSFQKIKHGYLIYAWVYKAFKGTACQQHTTYNWPGERWNLGLNNSLYIFSGYTTDPEKDET